MSEEQNDPNPRWRNHNPLSLVNMAASNLNTEYHHVEVNKSSKFWIKYVFCFVFVSVFMGVCVFFIRPSVGEGNSFLEFVSFNIPYLSHYYQQKITHITLLLFSSGKDTPP